MGLHFTNIKNVIMNEQHFFIDDNLKKSITVEDYKQIKTNQNIL